MGHHRAGRVADAEQLYRRILMEAPEHADSYHNLGLLLLGTPRRAQSRALIDAALRIRPGEALYWLSYIEVLLAAGQGEAARAALENATAQGHNDERFSALRARVPPAPAGNLPTQSELEVLRQLFGQGRFVQMAEAAERLIARLPQHAEGWKALGTARQQEGRHLDALAAFRRADQLAPHEADTAFNLAQCLRMTAQWPEAEAAYRRVLAGSPNDAEAHDGLGVVLTALGRFGEASAAHRAALAIDPGFADAQANLAVALKELGQFAEAEAACRQALKLNPQSVEAMGNLGVILHAQRRFAEAAAVLGDAVARSPRSAFLQYNLGAARVELRQASEAEAPLRAALELGMTRAEVHGALGASLDAQGRHPEAEAQYREAIALAPANAMWHYNLAFAQFAQLRVRDAIAAGRAAVALDPGFALAQQNLVFQLMHDPATRAVDLRDEIDRYGRMVGRMAKPCMHAAHLPDADIGRPLRIGFVSPDFRRHAVANYFMRIAEQLSTRREIEMFAYSNSLIADDVSARLRPLFRQWRDIRPLDDAAAAAAIHADAIDILVDLAGHTTDNRLALFAWKPAPIAASWIGHPGTTGVDAIDYYLTDARFVPDAQAAAEFREQIVRLPVAMSFDALEPLPPVSSLPALAAGHITFGSFNHARKLNPAVVAQWAMLLRAVERSTLLIAALPHDDVREQVLSWFDAQGIERSRLQLHDRLPPDQYLLLHHLVDVALDTFPVSGGATTLHALAMGVPTLTVAGASVAAGASAAIMRHLDLPQFVAVDARDYVLQGVAVTRDLAQLAGLRAGLRERLAHSAIGQPQHTAEATVQAFRSMWRRRCQGLAPAPISTSAAD